jgi:hypothetical protein|uniref:Uncharacterized protein n=1 Tax=Siphoviridae sp. ctsf32 TaxID=2827594 RepID=A0A8S5LNM6_9CAUD|nr:MAG TPA: hypothetical protein [Siphoviridae sp. ctsf32]
MPFSEEDLMAAIEASNQRKAADFASEAKTQQVINEALAEQAKLQEQIGKTLTDTQKFEIERAVRARQRYQMANLELNQQAAINKQNIEYLQNQRKQQQQKEYMLRIQRNQVEDENQRIEINEKLKRLGQEAVNTQILLDNAKERQVKIDEHIARGAEANATRAERFANAQQRANKFVEKQKENQKLHQRILRENQAIIEDTASTEEERAAARERIAQEQEDNENRNASALAESGFSSASSAEGLSTVSKILDVVSGISKKMSQNFTQAVNFQNQYMGKVDARLQSEEAQTGFFKQITDDVQSAVGASRFVSQKELLQNVAKLTENGIAYNIEQRAMLATLSDKMVTTFDVLDNTLQRMIRIQQADLTMSQLGSEAQLTKFLNSQFEDTSYLNTMYDSVLAALTDSISSMDKNNATSFTYAVQKWLASLYSVGLSDQAVATIASGINALASGNINTLNSNQPLSVLMNMSATNAGLSYSDLLTQGLNASNVNDLMRSMVDYLGTIAENTTDNQVLRSQWSDVLGITLTDLRAVSNLTNNDISAIYRSNTTYDQSINETQNQLQTVVGRTAASERVQTMADNFMFNWGMNMAQNDAQYMTWYATQFVDQLLGVVGLQNSTVGMITKVISALPMLSSLSETLGDISNTSLSLNTSGGGILGVLGALGNIITLPFNIASALGSAVGNMFDTMAGQNKSLMGFDWDPFTMRGTDYTQGIKGVAYSGGVGGLTGSYRSAQQSYNDVVITGSTFGYEAPVVEGLSSSAYYNTTGASSTINNLVTNATNLANATTAITGMSEQINTGANDIYKELFETQSTPIRVKLAELEKSSFDQLSNLILQLDPEGMKLLLEQIQNKIPTNDNSATYMMQMLDAVRRL